jgi:hypothetical protein
MARVLSIIDALQRNLSELGNRFRELTETFAGSTAKRRSRPAATRKAGTRKRRLKRATARKTAVAAAPEKRRRRVSTEIRKARQLQGKYLAALRALSKADRARVKRVRAEKGVAASLAEAKKLRK